MFSEVSVCPQGGLPAKGGLPVRGVCPTLLVLESFLCFVFIIYFILFIYFITVHNEVAKVMFLHLSVILFTGRGSTWAGPPWDQVQPPRDQVQPPGPGTPPGTRYTPPLETATVADGTHPTGMHSCI